MLKDSLMDWMPDYYTGEHVTDVQTARDEALSDYEEEQQRVYDDMYISSAKDIGLWEKEYEYTPTSSDLEERRKNLLAHNRNYGGSITADSLKTLIEGYVGEDGEVNVTEYPDSFKLKIVCRYNASEELAVDDLRTAILDTIQAHVVIQLDLQKINQANSALHFGMKLRGSYTVPPMIST